VVVSGNRKSVQPLTSGKITEILARDGDKVTKGQVLVRLDDTQAKAQLNIARGQWITASAVQARLLSEQLGLPAVRFPPELLALKSDPRAVAAVALQTELHLTRRRNLESELATLRENIAGTQAQIVGVDASRHAKREQLGLLQQELKGQRGLAEDGYLARNRVSEQERTHAAIVGGMAEDSGTIARAQQNIAEVKARMISRQQEVRKEVESQLTDVQKEAAGLANRIQALEFDLDNTDIVSPADGIVVGLAVHTVGGVVSAGAQLMDVVPQNETLRVDAQVPPHLIDKVQPGLDVDILFPAFQQSTTPHVPGKVLTVSADVLVEPKQQQPYFKVTAEVTPQGMEKLRTHQIRAGMPAEIMIKTGERTFWNYLFKPLTDRIKGSLTEP
jgi:protease secretion system membrane fusion protein